MLYILLFEIGFGFGDSIDYTTVTLEMKHQRGQDRHSNGYRTLFFFHPPRAFPQNIKKMRFLLNEFKHVEIRPHELFYSNKKPFYSIRD